MSETPEKSQGATISVLVEQATAAVRLAEEANRKANSEAGYAYNAKQAAEDQAKAISALKGQAESDASWFTATKQGVDQAQATINQIRAEAESAKQVMADAVTEMEKGRVVVKAASEQVEAHRGQAEKLAGDAVAHLKSAIASSSSAGVSREAASKSAEGVEEALKLVTEKATEVQAQVGKVDEVAIGINKAHETAQALVKSLEAADSKATWTLTIVENHEKDLARLKGEFEALHKRIESVLPNATSAGLATAFREQKARFEKPQQMWLVTFIVTIGGLLASSLWGLPANDSWDSMGRHFVNRLPLIAPLVWLAIYAGRHYGIALRLQEEYAYKEAVSAAFEGYKREMSSVGIDADGGSPLVTLCENVLRTLGQRPGRIYEGKHEDITPANTVANAAKEGATAVKEVMQAVTGGAKT